MAFVEVVGDGSGLSAMVTDTWSDFVRTIAEANGYDCHLLDDEIEWLLWERTAYPVAGYLYVRDQLIQEFQRMKEIAKVSEEELQTLEPVNEVPEDRSSRSRASKWDGIIDQVIALHDQDPSKWLPVGRPKNFAGAQVRWLCGRHPQLLVELRPEYIYLRWDPEKAAAKRAGEEQQKKAREAAKGETPE